MKLQEAGGKTKLSSPGRMYLGSGLCSPDTRVLAMQARKVQGLCMYFMYVLHVHVAMSSVSANGRSDRPTGYLDSEIPVMQMEV